MTREEQSYKRPQKFSVWIRKFLPNSKLGFTAFDIDFVFLDYIGKTVLVLEEKTHKSDLTWSQEKNISQIGEWIRLGINESNKFKTKKDKWQYVGTIKLQFENEIFNDGKAWISFINNSKNKKNISKEVTGEEFRNLIFKLFGMRNKQINKEYHKIKDTKCEDIFKINSINEKFKELN